ncbi:MAG TPA: replicative DNA helicase, partial [Acidiferrobacteraceae bacterium]|nr:replicative DNA helicase [Acidiferrobacteraceae bacterium]HEX19798.1 replicative DNA helicase [Acidiferrobacteraceae bacterium]
MAESAYSIGGIDNVAQKIKLPPQSIEAEQAVLGGLMLDNLRWDQLADKLAASDFYRKEHRLIYAALQALCDENNPADVVTVSEWLEKNDRLEQAGGLSYLASLADNTPSAANILAYAEIVHEDAVRRKLIEIAGGITDLAYQPQGRDAAALLDKAEQEILNISEQGARRRGGFEALSSLLTKTVDRIDELYRSDNPFTGIQTGYTDLDNMTLGLQKADLIIVAGRPSMGKTSLAMNIAENAAIGQKMKVGLFSLEMPSEQIAMRMLASLGRINSGKIRSGKLDDEDWPRLTSAMTLLAEAPIFVDDTPAITVMELRSRARRLQREHGLDMIIIDYLQLMQGPEGNENRATEISNITRALKAMAKELNIPVI